MAPQTDTQGDNTCLSQPYGFEQHIDYAFHKDEGVTIMVRKMSAYGVVPLRIFLAKFSEFIGLGEKIMHNNA